MLSHSARCPQMLSQATEKEEKKKAQLFIFQNLDFNVPSTAQG